MDSKRVLVLVLLLAVLAAVGAWQLGWLATTPAPQPVGHVIVGLDGFRVRDRRAYDVVRALSQSPRMKLVVWRGSGYDDVEVKLWDRWFRVGMDTLAPVASPKPAGP